MWGSAARTARQRRPELKVRADDDKPTEGASCWDALQSVRSLAEFSRLIPVSPGLQSGAEAGMASRVWQAPRHCELKAGTEPHYIGRGRISGG